MRIEYTEYGSGDGWVLLIHGRSVETKNQSPGPMAATIHGIFFGRIAPPARLRKQIPAAAMGITEWRRAPAGLNAEAISFVADCWSDTTSAAMRVTSGRQ